MLDSKLSKVEKEVGRSQALGCNQKVVIEAINGDLGWVTLKWRIKERRLRFLERIRQAERLVYQAWQESKDRNLPLAAEMKRELEDMELNINSQLTRQGWNIEVRNSIQEKDKAEWREAMDTKPTLATYRKKNEKEWEKWLGNGEEGCMMFRSRAGTMGLAKRTVRRKGVLDAVSGSKENEIHVLLLCPAYNKIRGDMSKQLKLERLMGG